MLIKKIDPDLVQLSTPYQKLFKLTQSIDTIDSKEWTIMHSLAYICNSYKKKFNNDYILSYSDSPSKSYEYKLCGRIWAMNSAKACDGEKVKEYIDWFFQTYTSKTPFRSVGALAKADLVSKFLDNKAKINIPKLNTPLPNNIIDIIKSFDYLSYITTYGDLLYLKKAYDEDNNSITQDVKELFSRIKNSGFNLSVLDKIS